MSKKISSVCIIDDDKMYINLISKIIEIKKLSEHVVIFKNGKEALDFFRTTIDQQDDNIVPQVIFLDLNMPVMDGWGFLQEFEKIKDKISKSIDLYVVSSSIDIRDIHRAKSFELVSDYLTKPVKLEDFEKILV